jgi:hypothetical protein
MTLYFFESHVEKYLLIKTHKNVNEKRYASGFLFQINGGGKEGYKREEKMCTQRFPFIFLYAH